MTIIRQNLAVFSDARREPCRSEKIQYFNVAITANRVFTVPQGYEKIKFVSINIIAGVSPISIEINCSEERKCVLSC
jgi:hypothetical protein